MGDEVPASGPQMATASHGASSAGIESMGAIRFPCPKAFDGKDENWEQFAIKLRSYLSTSHPNFRELMNQAEDSLEEIDYDLYEDLEKVLAAQLQNALVAFVRRLFDKDCQQGRRLHQWLRNLEKTLGQVRHGEKIQSY